MFLQITKLTNPISWARSRSSLSARFKYDLSKASNCNRQRAAPSSSLFTTAIWLTVRTFARVFHQKITIILLSPKAMTLRNGNLSLPLLWSADCGMVLWWNSSNTLSSRRTNLTNLQSIWPISTHKLEAHFHNSPPIEPLPPAVSVRPIYPRPTLRPGPQLRLVHKASTRWRNSQEFSKYRNRTSSTTNKSPPKAISLSWRRKRKERRKRTIM